VVERKDSESGNLTQKNENIIGRLQRDFMTAISQCTENVNHNKNT
jgi:hypothetical protein